MWKINVIIKTGLRYGSSSGPQSDYVLLVEHIQFKGKISSNQGSSTKATKTKLTTALSKQLRPTIKDFFKDKLKG